MFFLDVKWKRGIVSLRDLIVRGSQDSCVCVYIVIEISQYRDKEFFLLWKLIYFGTLRTNLF